MFQSPGCYKSAFVTSTTMGASSETAILELYDYQNDPLEKKNIAAEAPEVVTAMRKILDSYPEAKPQVKSTAKPPSSKPDKVKKK